MLLCGRGSTQSWCCPAPDDTNVGYSQCAWEPRQWGDPCQLHRQLSNGWRVPVHWLVCVGSDQEPSHCIHRGCGDLFPVCDEQLANGSWLLQRVGAGLHHLRHRVTQLPVTFPADYEGRDLSTLINLLSVNDRLLFVRQYVGR